MRTLTESAKAAKAIRAELKSAFPNTKFEVTNQNYSMGNSVNIRWKDFPFCKAVKVIIDKYEYGSFDGSQDLYEINNRRDDIPQTKYVQLMFSRSPEKKEELTQIICKKNNVWTNEECREKFHLCLDQFIWQQSQIMQEAL
jgi:hypothetical protein